MTTRVRSVARVSHRLQQGFGLLIIFFALAMYFQYDTLIAVWASGLYLFDVSWLPIRAKSPAEATDIMKRDPMHKSGARKFKIRPWFVNEGTLSVRLHYSQGTFEMI